MWSGVRIFTRLNRRERSLIKQCSTVAARKKQHVFYDTEVQGLLKTLTGLNQQKIFRTRNVGENIERSIYQFVTEEELQNMQKEFEQKAEMKIQMPPVMDERVNSGRVLEEDPHLVGFDVTKFVFTDITYGVSDRERIIVVRDIDGTLRTAECEEQDRINQTYYPREPSFSCPVAPYKPDNNKLCKPPSAAPSLRNQPTCFLSLKSTAGSRNFSMPCLRPPISSASSP